MAIQPRLPKSSSNMGSKVRERHRNRVIVTQAARSYLNLQNYIQKQQHKK